MKPWWRPRQRQERSWLNAETEAGTGEPGKKRWGGWPGGAWGCGLRGVGSDRR